MVEGCFQLGMVILFILFFIFYFLFFNHYLTYLVDNDIIILFFYFFFYKTKNPIELYLTLHPPPSTFQLSTKEKKQK